MYCHALSVEYSLSNSPTAELGDSVMSPLFHRVSAVCPVIHIFGYLRFLDPSASARSGQGGETLPTTHTLSTEGRHSYHPGGAPSSTGATAAATPTAATGHTLASTTSPAPHPPPTMLTSAQSHAPPPKPSPPAAWPSSEQRGTAGGEWQYRACVHVHGFYPYFLAPQYDAEVTPAQFGAQLETIALRVLFSADSGGASTRPVGSRGRAAAAPHHRQLIHDVELVGRVPFYGYHSSQHCFFKVSVIDPGHLLRIMGLLQETTEVGGRRWQLYGDGGRYHSQFMTHYGVSGAAPFILPQCSLRCPIASPGGRGATPRRGLHLLRSELLTALGVRRVYHPDELAGLTAVEAEADVAVVALTAGSEPGANMTHIRRLLRQYFADYGVPDHLRVRDDISTEEKAAERTVANSNNNGGGGVMRYGNVTQLQRNDAGALAMRSRMQVFLEEPTDGATTTWSRDLPQRLHSEWKSEATSTGGDGGATLPGGLTAPPLYVGVRAQSPSTGALQWQEAGDEDTGSGIRTSAEQHMTLTYELLEDLKKPLKTASLPTTPTMADEEEIADQSAHSSPAERSVERDEEILLLSSSSASCSCAQGESPHPMDDITPGRCVAFVIDNGGAEEEQQLECLCAACVIVSVDQSAHTVQLQWFIPLSETHLASSNAELVTRGAWMAARSSSGTSDTTPMAAGEVLLSNVVDTNPADILHVCLPLHITARGGQAVTARLRARPLQVSLTAASYQRCCEEADGREGWRPGPVALLCRYAYDVDSQLLMQLEDGAVAAALQRPAADRSVGDASPSTQRGLYFSCPEIHDACGDEDGGGGSAEAAESELFPLDDSSVSSNDSGSGGHDDDESWPGIEAHLLWLAATRRSGLDELERQGLCRTVAVRGDVSVTQRQQRMSTLSDAILFASLHADSLTLPAGPPHEQCIDVDAAVTVLSTSASRPASQGDSVVIGSAKHVEQHEDVVLYTQGPAAPRRPVVAPAAIDAVSPSLFFEVGRSDTKGCGSAVDGLRREFAYEGVTTIGGGDQRSIALHVSAATWPHTSHPESALGTSSSGYHQRGCGTSAPHHTAAGSAAAAQPAGPPPPLPLRKLPPTRARPSTSRTGPSDQHPLLIPSVTHQQLGQCVLRVLCVEVLVRRRGTTEPLGTAAIMAVGLGQATSVSERVAVHLLCVGNHERRGFPLSEAVPVTVLSTEAALLRRVCAEMLTYDPDVLLSWEGCKYGLGLLAQRYQTVLGRSLLRDLSRLHPMHCAPHGPVDGRAVRPTTTAVHNGTQSVGWRPLDGAPQVRSLDRPEETGDDECNGDEEDPPHGLHEPESGGANAPAAPLTAQQYARRFGASVRVTGRVCSSLGKELRKILHTPSHTLPVVHQHLLGRSLPYFTDSYLCELYEYGGRGGGVGTAEWHTVLAYLLGRVVAPHRIACHLSFYARNMEFSRMYGILYEEVLSRGSQFKVEATLHRMTLPQGYALLVPTREQVFRQPRISAVPLIMQPKSGFYSKPDDPIVVLDFRSLYPSIIMAYNLCYSTCLGLVRPESSGRLGVVTHYTRDAAVLRKLVPDDGHGVAGDEVVTIAPNGAMFLRAATREGVLPSMLRLILDTRFEVQAALRHVATPHDDVYLRARLAEQQLALKLLANVTYGYTAASFTGRMPCVDLADAIVSMGRQTLERAIHMIQSTAVWGADVVYGDTDSIFVRLPGRSKSEAFAIGREMARAVTAANPAPIRLQFEKVLHPCLLIVKKRYAGYAWHTPGQKEPEFLTKGIETVRRDQCGATARVMSAMLRQLLGGASEAQLRTFYHREASSLQRGDTNPAEYIFRRAVKLGRYQDEAHLPPGAQVALRRMADDLSHTPYWGERLPYVVVTQTTATSIARVRDQVIHPEQLLYRNAVVDVVLDTEYYLTRHVNAALDRVLYLAGISVAVWYNEMPRGRTLRSYLGKRSLAQAQRLLEACTRGDAASLSALKRMRLEQCGDSESGGARTMLVNVDECMAGRDGSADTAVVVDDDALPTAPAQPTSGAATAEGSRQRTGGTLDAYFTGALCAVCQRQSVATRAASAARDTGGTAAPAICAECWRDPATLLGRLSRRCHDAGVRLHAARRACVLCIGGAGTAGGPTLLPSAECVLDIEDIPPCVAVPPHVADAVSLHDAGCGPTARGCVSVDCSIAFAKRRLTLLYEELTVVLRYVQVALDMGGAEVPHLH